MQVQVYNAGEMWIDGCWVDTLCLVGCEPGCPRPCHLFFIFFLLPIPSSIANQLRLLLPTVNLFHQPAPDDNHMGVGGGQGVYNSLYGLHCHCQESNPCPTLGEALTGQFHSSTAYSGALTPPHCKPGYCGYGKVSWCRHWSTARMRMCGRQIVYIPVVLAQQWYCYSFTLLKLAPHMMEATFARLHSALVWEVCNVCKGGH